MTNPPPSHAPAFSSIDPCALSLATVHTAMCPMFPRTTAELPPIEDLPMYADIQPRTPIDPPTKILGVVFKGNTDINPTVRADVPAYRDCTVCAGRGVTRGVACQACGSYGRVRR